MIPALILSSFISPSCPETKLIGFDKPLTKIETQSLNSAKKRCPEIYEDSPCLKSFEKREEQVFRAICGEETK